MLARALAAAAGIPVLVAAVWWGAPGLTFLVLFLAVLGVREFYRLMPSRIGSLPIFLGVIWALSFALAAQANASLGNSFLISSAVLAAGAFVALLWMVAYYLGERPLETAAYLVGGPVYAGFLLGHVAQLVVTEYEKDRAAEISQRFRQDPEVNDAQGSIGEGEPEVSASDGQAA